MSKYRPIPGTVPELTKRLASIEAMQTLMKAANLALKHRQPGKLEALGLDQDAIATLTERHGRTGKAYPPGHLKEGARMIRHIRRTLASLPA